MEAGRREVSLRVQRFFESVVAPEHPRIGHRAEVSSCMSFKLAIVCTFAVLLEHEKITSVIH